MNKQQKEYRAAILASNLPKYVKPVMRVLRSNGVFCYNYDTHNISSPVREVHPDFVPPGSVMTYNNAVKLFNDKFFQDRVAWYTAVKINESEYNRKGRLRGKIRVLFEKPCSFVTLTFNDSALQRTSIKSRRIEVARFCKSNSKQFVANVDCGDLNGREHYHAIIQSDIIYTKEWNERFGFTCVEKIDISDKSEFLLTLYIDKLTNHAIKSNFDTTRLIFSRRDKIETSE